MRSEIELLKFFDREPLSVARELLGASLMGNGVGGNIVETEAYSCEDPASYSYGEKENARNYLMFGPPGTGYNYRS